MRTITSFAEMSEEIGKTGIWKTDMDCDPPLFFLRMRTPGLPFVTFSCAVMISQKDAAVISDAVSHRTVTVELGKPAEKKGECCFCYGECSITDHNLLYTGETFSLKTGIAVISKSCPPDRFVISQIYSVPDDIPEYGRAFFLPSGYFPEKSPAFTELASADAGDGGFPFGKAVKESGRKNDADYVFVETFSGTSRRKLLLFHRKAWNNHLSAF